jgi:MFS family permease
MTYPDGQSAQKPASQQPGGLRGLVRSLRHRNYRLFFGGQIVSLIGTWMQGATMGYLVYKLTGSKVLLGLLPFVSQLPTFVATPFAGVLADRFDRRKLLLFTQSTAMVLAAVLGLLTVTGAIQIWHMLVIGAIGGLVQALDVPTRQSFVVQMVEDRADLPNAIALNSMMVNGAKLVGPSVAGVLIWLLSDVLAPAIGVGHRFFGEGVCVLLNAASFVAVLACLLKMRVAPFVRPTDGRRMLASLAEGLHYAWRFVPIRAVLLLLATTSLVGIPYVTLIPVFSRDILHADGMDAMINGLLIAASGAGALVGAMHLASRRNVIGLGRLIALGPGLFGASLILFALSRNWVLSLLVLVPAGIGQMILIASCNTFIQTIVDDDKRGRVMSIYAMSFMGMSPFGALAVGWAASWLGAPLTVGLCGGACIVGSLVFRAWLPRHREILRPIYTRMGILPAQTPAALGAEESQEAPRP